MRLPGSACDRPEIQVPGAPSKLPLSSNCAGNSPRSKVSDVVLCLKRELRLLEYTFVDVRLQDDNGVYVVDHLRQVRNGRHHTMGQEFFPWSPLQPTRTASLGPMDFHWLSILGGLGKLAGSNWAAVGRAVAWGPHPGRN